MKLFICTSHLYVPAVLDLLYSNPDESCIYSDRDSIIQFFKVLYPEMNTVITTHISGKNSIDNAFIRVLKKQHYLKRYFKGEKIERVVFFHEGYCEEANWLIRHLWKSQHSEIIYMPVERTFERSIKWQEAYSLKLFLKKVHCYLFWGYWVHFYKYMNYLCPVMDSSFYSRVHCKEVPVDYQAVNVLSTIDNRLLNPNIYPYSSVIWLENSLRYMNVQWNIDSYIDFLARILPSIPVNDIFFKGHPDMALKYGLETQMIEMPSFIPGNLLLKRFSCFVGAISDLMFEAANAGTLAISTLYLFEIEHKDREMLVDYLKNRSPEIKFPKTIDELLMLIRSAI